MRVERKKKESNDNKLWEDASSIMLGSQGVNEYRNKLRRYLLRDKRRSRERV